MFDFSFGEMLVMGTVALVVIGPERLPKVARTLGAILGRAQRYMNNVKADIQREIDLDNLKKLEAEMNAAGRQIMGDIQRNVNDVQQTLHDTARDVETAVAPPPVAPAPAQPAEHATAPVVSAEPSPIAAEAPPAETVCESTAPSHLVASSSGDVAARVATPPAPDAVRPERDRR